MTTLEIILLIAVIYLAIAHGWNFFCINDGCMLCDNEDLLCNLFWIVMLPIALIRLAIKKIKKFKKVLDKTKKP